MKKSSSITTFDEHLEKRYGKAGEEGRMAFEAKAKAFAIGELIKEERRLSKMTQEQLAIKTGTKKSFISRIENGKSDISMDIPVAIVPFAQEFCSVKNIQLVKKNVLFTDLHER